MRRLSHVYVVGFLILAGGMAWAGVRDTQKDSHRRLAEYYAPVIYQETKSHVLDFITRFDFDGDWNGANNWQNAYTHELPGYVYYAVIESTDHFFITYTFFHPRDYTGRPLEGFAPKTEHENDMEGCTLLIEKDRTEWGKPILLETLAHDHFFKYDNPHYRRVKGPSSGLDGSIVFLKKVDDTHHREPAIYIEPEGHGVKGASESVRDPSFKHPGVIYRFAGRGAEVPKGATDPDVSYELISIEETLWSRRLDVGKDQAYCCADRYSTSGGRTTLLGSSFNGPIGGCAAKPPWGWDDPQDGAIQKGDWFRDPLFAYNEQLRITGLKGRYLHNPYLEEGDGEDRSLSLCSESSVSQDLKQSATSTLLGIGKILFSGGLSRKQVGDKARQLFLSDAVLLEWSSQTEFEQWHWDKPVEGLSPAVVTEGISSQLRIPLLQNFNFSSPRIRAPAQYFDSLVMKYKCSVAGARAKVFWVYEGMETFDENYSETFDLKKADDWALTRIELSRSRQWDRSKSVGQLKIEVLSPTNEKIASIDSRFLGSPTPTTNNQFVINYIIFDRSAFADTFAR
ncbi:MAG: hypothetical protein AB1898_17430 [Acidobacteriota bacterium]